MQREVDWLLLLRVTLADLEILTGAVLGLGEAADA